MASTFQLKETGMLNRKRNFTHLLFSRNTFSIKRHHLKVKMDKSTLIKLDHKARRHCYPNS